MQTLTELLPQLEAAVRDGNLSLARELIRQAEQLLVLEAETQAGVERRLRELIQQMEMRELLEEQQRQLERVTISDVLDGDKSWRSAEAVDKEVYPVWFGTNRKPVGKDRFGTERHHETTRGRAEVHIPAAHRFGEIGSSFWKKLTKWDFRDDTLKLQKVTPQEREAWFAEIKQAMLDAKESGGTSHALFFLHGFNVTFEEAAIRAAQLGCDLKVPGATAFFSWPSRGSVTAYPADEATIEASERAITDFLVDFAANCGADKIHVIAHSMGNRGLLRALQRIAANAGTRGKVKFGQIFLAAPDVDRDLFLDLASLYPEHSERTTLYASHKDLPVHVSSKLHDAARAGYFEPYTVAAGVDSIAVPDFDIDLLGHSYFAQAKELLQDIYQLMRHNEPPSERFAFRKTSLQQPGYWQFSK